MRGAWQLCLSGSLSKSLLPQDERPIPSIPVLRLAPTCGAKESGRTHAYQQKSVSLEGAARMLTLSGMSDSATPGLQPSRLLCPWDSPGKNTRTRSSSRGSCPPRDQTRVPASCVAGGVFAPEAPGKPLARARSPLLT